jgi:hypothetical protein
MQPPRNVTDGSTNPPRLLIYANGWAALELPKLPRDGAAWSTDEFLDRIKSAGYHGFQGGAADAKRCHARGLRFCTSGRINAPAEADPALKAAADSGADCMTIHAGWGMEDDAQVDGIVHAILDLSAKHDVPAYIETHRATLAQDMWRIVQLIKRIPEVRFNGDFSHLYCGQEMPYGGFENKFAYMRPIFQRCSFFHGRISDGQCMQADVGDGRDNVHAKHFQQMWTESMTSWLKTANPGDILPFTPELGPPSSKYSIMIPDAAGRAMELSDRWAQSLVLKRLAEESFASAQKSST